MRELNLYRVYSDDQGTVGYLFDGARFICYVIELPWRDNRANISCIPAGRYEAEFLARSASGRYRNVYHVTGVPGRGGILMHSGNWAGDIAKGYRTHSHGCLLPAKRLGQLKGQRAGLASKAACEALRNHIGDSSFILNVHAYTGGWS